MSNEKYYEWQGMIFTTKQMAKALGISRSYFNVQKRQNKLPSSITLVPPFKRVWTNSHPLFRTYHNMKSRCYNRNSSTYPRYGGRGIRVCDRWLESREAFYQDMGERPPGMTLDRIDNDGNYEPSNCRWATHQQQTDNQRTHKNALWATDGQKSQSASDWAHELEVNRHTLWKQLRENRHPSLTLLGRYGELYPEAE